MIRPPLIRPPSEADSLILQVTYGCSHNRCAFCVTYKNRPFCARPHGDIAAEIDQVARQFEGVRRVFLGDGDPMALSPRRLSAILAYLRRRLPSVRRVTAYASPGNFAEKSVKDLAGLRELGLTQVYIGFESGDDEVLRRIDKGVSRDDIVAACDKLNEAGIKISAIVILGLGGPHLSMRHAERSADLINRTRPRFTSALTLMLPGGMTPFTDAFERGDWRELTSHEILRECRRLLECIDANGVIFRANHISNYLALAGTLQKNKSRLLSEIDDALRLREHYRIREGF